MKPFIRSNNGFSLIEVIIALSLFTVVLMITSSAFNSMLTKGNIVQRSEESNIEGVIGMEIFRHDIAQAGYGLFTEFIDSTVSLNPPVFNEAINVPANTNDAGAIPRAVVTLDSPVAAGVLPGTDYIALKATSLGEGGADGATAVSQLHTYVTETAVPATLANNQVFNDSVRVIALEEYFDKVSQSVNRKLIMKAIDNYAFKYMQTGDYIDMKGNIIVHSDDDNPYRPRPSRRYTLRGIAATNATAAFSLRAPFNRTDFFVATNEVPAHCAPGTGVLRKGIMTHNDNANSGALNPFPILDCVANMQIVLGWNTTDDHTVMDPTKFVYTDAAATGLNNYLTSAEEIRKRLRQVRIYILAQDGNQDRNFRNTNNNFRMSDDPLVLALVGPNVDLTVPNMVNFRWKLHKIIVNLKM